MQIIYLYKHIHFNSLTSKKEHHYTAFSDLDLDVFTAFSDNQVTRGAPSWLLGKTLVLPSQDCLDLEFGCEIIGPGVADSVLSTPLFNAYQVSTDLHFGTAFVDDIEHNHNQASTNNCLPSFCQH